jgi:hypothetical protein
LAETQGRFFCFTFAIHSFNDAQYAVDKSETLLYYTGIYKLKYKPDIFKMEAMI